MNVTAEIGTLGGWKFVEPYRLDISKLKPICRSRITEPEGEVVETYFIETEGDEVPLNVGCKSNLGLEGDAETGEPVGFWARYFGSNKEA